jgi:hypothetical protein
MEQTPFNWRTPFNGRTPSAPTIEMNRADTVHPYDPNDSGGHRPPLRSKRFWRMPSAHTIETILVILPII